MLEDGGSRLLIGPSHLMVGMAGLNRVWDREQARALLRRYVNEGWEMSALRQLAADHGIGQRQSIPDGNFLDLMAGQTTSWPFVMIQLPRPIDIADELAGMPDGTGGDDGSLNPAIYRLRPVADWSLAQKLHFVVEHALPLVGPEARKQLEALLDPAAILWTVGIIAGMIAATAAGVGAIFALAVSALAFAALGWAAVDFIRKVGEFLDNTVGARSEKELLAASAALAAAVAIGGVALIRALLRRAGKTSTAGVKQKADAKTSTNTTTNNKAGGKKSETKGKNAKSTDALATARKTADNIAKKGDFTTKPDSSVFYSGKGNRDKALASIQSGGQPIDSTPGGRALDGENLYGEASLLRPEADSYWSTASRRFAESASGNVTAYVKGAQPDRVFGSTELPVLLRNPKVTNINGIPRSVLAKMSKEDAFAAVVGASP